MEFEIGQVVGFSWQNKSKRGEVFQVNKSTNTISIRDFHTDFIKDFDLDYIEELNIWLAGRGLI